MKVVRLLFLSLLAGACSLNLLSEDSRPKFLKADLDGDGKAERISWVKFAETENEGDFYQVRVIGSDGSLLWASPKVTDTENPLVFGDWHFGYSLPQLAADIDGDGAIELVAPAPQSDVSPTSFRVMRWQGERFVPARSGSLLESPKGTGKFPWSETDESEGRWISSFLGANEDGSLNVALFEYRDGADARVGKARIAPAPGGYEVRKWTETMKVPNDDFQLEPAPMASTPVDGITYRARLSSADHFNSAGVRLEKVGDILRQDRANFHQGNGDAEDETDSKFGTRKARNKMESMTPVVNGGEREVILSGTPLVEVEIAGEQLIVRLVE